MLKIDSRPRLLLANISRSQDLRPAVGTTSGAQIRGNCFTTESHIVPFEAEQNSELRRNGEGLLEFGSRRRSYLFVIDRFGRVFRIVKENDYANHAGNSVWEDDEQISINLNQSFFSAAFEAKNNAEGGEIPVNPPKFTQRASCWRRRTDGIRFAPKIVSVTGHVSVNPDNGRAGYHVD